jgi:hypothetical protein
MHKLTAVLAAVFAIAPQAADAKCIRLELRPKLVTTRATVPLGGGLVVAEDAVAPDDKVPVLAPATWKLTAGGRPVAIQPEVLAPGLTRYPLPTKVSTVDVREGTKVIGSMTLSRRHPATLSAPAVKAIVSTATVGRRASESLEVQLSAPLPAGTVAVVIADKSGKGRSFALVDQEDLKDDPLSVYGLHRTRCSSLPEGTVHSVPGDEVIVYVVDQLGRRSPATAPIKVTGSISKTRDL